LQWGDIILSWQTGFQSYEQSRKPQLKWSKARLQRQVLLVYFCCSVVNRRHIMYFSSTSPRSPWPPSTEARLTPLSRRAVLVLQTISTTGPVVASVLSPKEVSYVAERVRNSVALASHRVRSLLATSWEDEEEVWSSPLARGSSEPGTIAVRATLLQIKGLAYLWPVAYFALWL